MYNDELDAILQTTLEDGETVRWRGKSAPYKLLDKDNKKGTLTFWLIAIAIMVGASLAYTLYALNADMVYQPFVLILTIGFPLLVFIDPIRDKGHIGKQVFVITDRRILILHKNTAPDKKAIGLRFSDMDTIRVEDLEEGFSRIRIGSETLNISGLKLRRKAMQGAMDKDEKVIGLVLYHISNEDRNIICSALHEESVTIEKTA